MDITNYIDLLLDTALKEDIRTGDITSEACIPEDAILTGRFIAKQAGILAGLPFLSLLFKKIDPRIEVQLLVSEGSYQKAGTVIAKAFGPARGIFSGERVALNLLQHASGVATLTNQYVRKVSGFDCSILDTRKTLPGLRALEKYAVTVGGGVNHRFGLDDRLIIKRNHLAFVGTTTPHPIREAVLRVKNHRPDLPIEIEIQDIDQLAEALDTEAETIMLCRMPPHEIKKCVHFIRKTGKKVFIESLGTITLETIQAYAETGVDGISLGSLTLSSHALDIAMRLASSE
ncbi:carboxylating nicotinate-nucleotide diphosphorylase [Parachlamydia acanthamoebae]|uniref:carboxylating nicotinate-nucleotide diphosphorylase n=1 Tax=Parachlamydia acanthamoebae TaxID=83552 RepID=UPI000750D615|nr:carboxylating nicotinate-nucleotide diphosphorylase [Parachlamydia acanthamoebae]